VFTDSKFDALVDVMIESPGKRHKNTFPEFIFLNKKIHS
jgi:hypothetical protein